MKKATFYCGTILHFTIYFEQDVFIYGVKLSFVILGDIALRFFEKPKIALYFMLLHRYTI